MNADQELRAEELLVLESVLSEEEFHHQEGSGCIDVFISFPDGIELVLVDSTEKAVRFRELHDTGFTDLETILEDRFCGFHAKLTHLPPIRISFTLPSTYPSDEPPRISLCACWLPRETVIEITSLCTDLWNQNGHQAVLYEYFQALLDKGSAGELFPFQSPVLPIFSSMEFIPAHSTRFLVTNQPRHLFLSLIQFNDNRTVVLFQKDHHRCEVCFESHPGTNFIRLANCHHFVCKDCMTSLCTEVVKEGAVHRLVCMECQEPLNPSDIELSVEESVWERYQKFQLDTALSQMHDVLYCPRPWCNQVVITEKDCNLSQCPGCQYSFCKLCFKGYHGVEPCAFGGDKKILAQQYDVATKKEKEELERKFGKNALTTLVNEIKAEEWLSGNTKQCPKCKFRVEKMSGCNKIICTKCGTPFCWICQKNLGQLTNPYEHFRTMDNKQCFGNLWLGETFGEADSDDEFFEDDFTDSEDDEE